MWKPEMPFAPVTIAVRPLMSGEKEGRFLNMPLFWRGNLSEPILAGLCDEVHSVKEEILIYDCMKGRR